MMIRVVFQDNTCDMISDAMLQVGIDCRKIKMFYRSSEKNWVVVGVDPIRECIKENTPFAGPERRNT